MQYCELPQSAGVYVIENQATGYSYIGSGNNMMLRGSQHYRMLKGMRHTNRMMQYDWNGQIESQFSIRVLEQCLVGEIRDREQHWIDEYLKTKKPLYNRMLRVPDRHHRTSGSTWV
jgi:excinuclease UvrABC nuclease subunit